MKFKYKITQLTIAKAASSVLASGFLFGAIAIQPTQAEVTSVAQALAPEEVNLRAKQIVVRIDGANVGSGFILESKNSTYTVLTNWHVMKNQGSYTVQTIDGRKHQVTPTSIKQLPGVDLAILQFNADQNYQTAELGDSSSLSEGQIIYFAGYPGELRREDNRYYRFFTANIVGILPNSSENGYSLIYSGEAFPGMSGGPVLNRDGVVIGIHGEANINAISGGTSNYAIPIVNYQQAIAKLKTQPTAQTPPATTNPKPEVAAQKPPVKTPASTSQQSSPNSPNVSSVPTFSSGGKPAQKPATKPEVIVETETEPKPPELTKKPEVIVETETEPKQPEVEQISVTNGRKIALISPRTGIDYTRLRDLLEQGKWSEADLHTYQLVEQIIKSAKNDNKHVFIELKTIAKYSCPDIRTVDSLWKKYSNDQFGFSPQQEVWQSVNQDGDFSTQTWRRFATEVGWKKGDTINGSGYLLYDQLEFEPSKAPPGQLPWWFSLPDEEQKVIKSLFARCNFNPTTAELEAEAKDNSGDTAQNPDHNNFNSKNQPNISKPPKSNQN
ncbi:MAG: trypsin-like serine protease [Pleurocapsa sp. SU_5_0]|nr:trypsin-like serine protease [Pleurocapsa sp. SU_5_0]NJR46159.1 trypsin-like serine protease [Hyellaceae cyanobacterium CSU_1_1]